MKRESFLKTLESGSTLDILFILFLRLFVECRCFVFIATNGDQLTRKVLSHISRLAFKTRRRQKLSIQEEVRLVKRLSKITVQTYTPFFIFFDCVQSTPNVYPHFSYFWLCSIQSKRVPHFSYSLTLFNLVQTYTPFLMFFDSVQFLESRRRMEKKTYMYTSAPCMYWFECIHAHKRSSSAYWSTYNKSFVSQTNEVLVQNLRSHMHREYNLQTVRRETFMTSVLCSWTLDCAGRDHTIERWYKPLTVRGLNRGKDPVALAVSSFDSYIRSAWSEECAGRIFSEFMFGIHAQYGVCMVFVTHLELLGSKLRVGFDLVWLNTVRRTVFLPMRGTVSF